MPINATDLNEGTLREMIDALDMESVRSLIDFYVEETRERMPKMRILMGAANLKELQTEAHSLKGASRTYGAAGLGELAFELEKACKENSATEAEKWLAEAEAAAEPAIGALMDYLDHQPENG